MNDQYLKCETNDFHFIRKHQEELRASDYASFREELADYGHFEDEVDLVRAREMNILPSTFAGCYRYMRQKLQDIMGISTKIGNPDIFVTMTCNPNWLEIKRYLLKIQTVNSRPDILGRVFRMKMKHMMEVIHHDVYGTCVAYVVVVEFQKSGFPHAYCICFLNQTRKN